MERNSFFLQELGSNSPGFLELETKKKGMQKGMHNLGSSLSVSMSSLHQFFETVIQFCLLLLFEFLTFMKKLSAV